MRSFSVALLFVALGSASAWACVPASPAEFDVGESEIILIGNAASSRWLPHTADLLVDVKVIETLRGESIDLLKAFSPCAVPISTGERVIVVGSKARFLVYPADMYEHAARARDGR